MKTLRIVSKNPVYAYKGRLFESKKNGEPVDHEVDDDLAKELLGFDGTPFREVQDGEVVPNDADVARSAKERADRESRTTHVNPRVRTTTELTGGADAKAEAAEPDQDDEDEETVPLDEQDPVTGEKVDAKAKTTKITINKGGAKKAAKADTEGAVEV